METIRERAPGIRGSFDSDLESGQGTSYGVVTTQLFFVRVCETLTVPVVAPAMIESNAAENWATVFETPFTVHVLEVPVNPRAALVVAATA